jgi:hypothetical protein
MGLSPAPLADIRVPLPAASMIACFIINVILHIKVVMHFVWAFGRTTRRDDSPVEKSKDWQAVYITLIEPPRVMRNSSANWDLCILELQLALLKT